MKARTLLKQTSCWALMLTAGVTNSAQRYCMISVYGECAYLSNNPAKIRALEQCGIEIVERVALEVKPAEAAMRYLRTKKEKMGHLINII